MSCCSLGKEVDLLIKTRWGLSHHLLSCTSKTVQMNLITPLWKQNGCYSDVVGESLCDTTKSQKTSEEAGPLPQSVTTLVFIYISVQKYETHTDTCIYVDICICSLKS